MGFIRDPISTLFGFYIVLWFLPWIAPFIVPFCSSALESFVFRWRLLNRNRHCWSGDAAASIRFTALRPHSQTSRQTKRGSRIWRHSSCLCICPVVVRILTPSLTSLLVASPPYMPVTFILNFGCTSSSECLVKMWCFRVGSVSPLLPVTFCIWTCHGCTYCTMSPLHKPTVSKQTGTHCFPSKIRTVHPTYEKFLGNHIPFMHGETMLLSTKSALFSVWV